MTVTEYNAIASKNMSESQLQRTCVKWFRLTYPQYAKLLFAIPNGGKRSLITAANLKKEGVIPGVPDMFLAIARQGFNGLFIEMKRLNGRESENQLLIIEQLSTHGYSVMLCRSLDQFIQYVTYYLG